MRTSKLIPKEVRLQGHDTLRGFQRQLGEMAELEASIEDRLRDLAIREQASLALGDDSQAQQAQRDREYWDYHLQQVRSVIGDMQLTCDRLAQLLGVDNETLSSNTLPGGEVP